MAEPEPSLNAMMVHFAMLFGKAGEKDLIELRYRRLRGRMGQRFFPASRLGAAATAAFELSRRRDVFFGVCPRTRRAGRRDAVTAAWAIWADCDGLGAVEELHRFAPAPALVVRSGTGENRHAYWPLAEPLSPDAVESANRRLARALGADADSTDAARVLRPPSTLNFKTDPPTSVVLDRLAGRLFYPGELLDALPADEPGERMPSQQLLEQPADLLRRIAPVIYVAVLTGEDVPSDRKVSCPFHRDRTPSLHVYETPEEGWFCFGCRRGGSVYDLGAALFGLATHGREFHELRRRLYTVLLPGRLPPG